jgi:hypothetical protein
MTKQKSHRSGNQLVEINPFQGTRCGVPVKHCFFFRIESIALSSVDKTEASMVFALAFSGT